ncbi:hypothetical protein [Neobacillus cucumis]|uniref:hypothetical protein n=1 Tax=Neobacillus cucumis TaxID=1740721 RepID=UPI001966245C|nr:hypothetical protein [Neobacillus cucumis]MBM7652612.1 hypothetical protein [Neobacillus cucumis]
MRNNIIAAGILTVLLIYPGSAGWNRLTGGGFDVSVFLREAVANPAKGSVGAVAYGWYVDFFKQVALPNVHIFNSVIPLTAG